MLAELLGRLFGYSLFDYLSFRTAMAAMTAFALALITGGPTIAWLRARSVRDNVDTSGSADLAEKARQGGKNDTTTMGGAFLIVSLLAAVLLWADVTSMPVVLAVVLTAGLGAVGFVDDYRKLTEPESRGLTRRAKLVGMSVVTLAVLVALVQFALLRESETLLALYPPLFKDARIDFLAWGPLGLVVFVGFQWLVVVGTANAANIVDGLDGLAAGCMAISGLALTLFCYVTGRADWTAYLSLPHVPAAGDMAVVGGALCGACLGFLWFNAYPAKVFMGDSGSLPLGGLLAWMAVVSKQELVLPLIAIVLVVDLGSSWLQTFWYRRSGGRRIFTCAPVHHGLQLYGGVFKRRAEGIHEVTVVIRFWILAIVGALASLALLKVR
ncbi:phospho-N-acetylmuramoyl-pentapeptide-transferase [Engelhardtia mirabilis]|uniref:Phospho-N-acetylmuramoyl-pentapeptide-transferase n=1 Tax=Engelhardtia mirabilis TaxID=2528011 RepID=A0A518BIB0_9BACT|nr:Phospho-N-acetylmuramoyl-pentapeptide-transferase MraY [Planctomycetes bacterium Pla133]QDV01032.1 Phospho-N-acetylmuramoyl-pentapeptide-transferase MraY [Planctomycetes bacterium Pla86]